MEKTSFVKKKQKTKNCKQRYSIVNNTIFVFGLLNLNSKMIKNDMQQVYLKRIVCKDIDM